MKRILIAILVLFFCSSVFSQLNFTDKKGRKQGTWQKAYPKSTALEYKGNFIDDKPVGVFTFYYPSTKVKAVIRHSNNFRSEAYFYHENGEIMTYGIYTNLKKDSVWLNFGPSGRISYKESYKSDILDGPKIVYFISEDINNKSSKISSSWFYKNGKLDGEFKEYFDFGSIKTVGQFANDKKIGEWHEYHPNGQKMAMTRYKEGAKHGWCTTNDESGKELSRLYFYKGKLKQGRDLELLMKQMKEKGVNPND